VEDYLAETIEDPDPNSNPVIFFNASTRIHRLSLNAAFSMLAGWGLRLRGTNVLNLLCDWGMEQCILGTAWEDLSKPPPCKQCLKFSSLLFPAERVIRLRRDHPAWADLPDISNTSLEQLIAYSFKDYPLGKICLAGLQWAMRKTNLEDRPAIRSVFHQYLKSAAFLVLRFEEIFSGLKPQALVVFNGIFYPEAVAREVAARQGIPVVTHEVGLRPYSAFFSHQHATFRQVDIPDGFELTEVENERLDEYLEDRFSGRFSMAGIEFWPKLESTPDWLNAKIGMFKNMVVVFTNVIFDTSQIHANAVFKDMFEWLDGLVEFIREHPDYLFIIRAHPDEDRDGKHSRESVSDWIRRVDLLSQNNVAFIEPSEYVSSYELIERSTLVLVYNSSIGLEASIMGKRVVCAGKARYTQANTVFFPDTIGSYWITLEELIKDRDSKSPADFRSNARKLLHIESFQACLEFTRYLKPDPVLPGMVVFSEFDPAQLKTDPVLDVIRNGILETRPFILPRSHGLI
jgi:hypothetical protein